MMTKSMSCLCVLSIVMTPGLVLSASYAHAAPGPAQAGSVAKSDEAPPIEWLPWSEEVFARSRRETRGVLLSVVTKWCKPCRTMDEEVWSDPEVRRWVKRAWIPVRVDAEERPDINSRYQLVVTALNRARTGLPVTAFLFPTGEAMWADLFIPADDHEGRPGLRTLLPRMADFWLSRFGEAKQNAMEVQRTFDAQAEPRHKGAPDAGLISAIVGGALARHDRRHGGYGPPPRSTNHLAARLILLAAQRRADDGLRAQGIRALRAAVEGSVFDRLEGGFHAGVVDPAWNVPISGKSLVTNASYLRSLTDGIRVSGDEALTEAADKTVDYVLATLAAPDKTGFYARQAPSADRMNDAAYYTWTVKEVSSSLSEEDRNWASLLFGLRDQGEPELGLPVRFTLKTVRSVQEASREAGAEEAAARDAQARITARLASQRASRTPPPVLEVAYVDGTSLMSSALIHAGAVLGREDAIGAALAALDAILKAHPALDGGVPHRIAAPEGAPSPLLMTDLAFLGNALVDAYEFTGEERYLEAARKAASGLLALFLDEEEGGFFDVIAQENASGYLRLRRKFISDLPVPSPQAAAVDLLDRVAHLTGDEKFRRGIEPTLAWVARRIGYVDERAAGFAMVLDAILRHRVVVSVSSDAEGGDALLRAVWNLQEPSRVLRHVKGGAEAPASATICIESICREGIVDPDALAAEIAELRARARRDGDSVAAR